MKIELMPLPASSELSELLALIDDANIAVIEACGVDLVHQGVSFQRFNANGRSERIDPSDVIIHGR